MWFIITKGGGGVSQRYEVLSFSLYFSFVTWGKLWAGAVVRHHQATIRAVSGVIRVQSDAAGLRLAAVCMDRILSLWGQRTTRDQVRKIFLNGHHFHFTRKVSVVHFSGIVLSVHAWNGPWGQLLIFYGNWLVGDGWYNFWIKFCLWRGIFHHRQLREEKSVIKNNKLLKLSAYPQKKKKGLKGVEGN